MNTLAMAKNSKRSIKKKLEKLYRKSFPGKMVFVKRYPVSGWMVFVWNKGEPRGMGYINISFHEGIDMLTGEGLQWIIEEYKNGRKLKNRMDRSHR